MSTTTQTKQTATTNTNTSTTGGKLTFSMEAIELVENVLNILKKVFPQIPVKEGRQNLDRDNLDEQISTALKIVQKGIGSSSSSTNNNNNNEDKSATAKENLKGGSVSKYCEKRYSGFNNISKMLGYIK